MSDKFVYTPIIPEDQCKVYNGSPFDRGSADSYYRRHFKPHFWPQGTGKGYVVSMEQMTPREIAEYCSGWDYNENFYRDFKDWG